jgi:hypothetical protein
MRSASWAALLRHIPPEQHHQLMLVTKAGQEININNVLRIDEEFLAFRGRLAASQESGRLFFVPYSNIDYFGYQKPIKDSDFQETFGNFESVAPAAEPTAPATAAPVASAIGTRGGPAIKSAALERFRSRSSTVIGSAVGTPLAPGTNGSRPPADG